MPLTPSRSAPIFPPAGCTLAEQAAQAEIAYYRQLDACAVTADDEAAWQRYRTVYEKLRPLVGQWAEECHPFTRFVLERHGYSLHRYMARQLNPAAWTCWFTQGGLLAPFRPR